MSRARVKEGRGDSSEAEGALSSTNIVVAVAAIVITSVTIFLGRRIAAFLQQHLGYLLDTATFYANKAMLRSRATHFSFRQYCKLQLARSTTRYLPVPGKEQTVLEVDDVFVPLSLEAVGGLATRNALGYHSVLAAGPRVRIIGDPGSGKSSLVKRLFRDACNSGQRMGASKAAVLQLKLPIRVELKLFGHPPAHLVTDSELGEWGIDQLRASVAAVEGFEMTQLFDSYVTGPGTLVLLDGLDEVASDAYRRTAQALTAMSRRLADLSAENVVVLTMRSQFHQQIHADFDDEFPPVFHVAPFTPGDIYRFLTNWPFEDSRYEQVTRIYGELTDRPTLREMCRNPLVLSMYVANDQNAESAASPDTRTSFYDQVVEELLVTRRSRQLGISARTTLREQREALLGRLALDNLTEASAAANTLPWDEAVKLTAETFNCANRETAEARLRELATDTGIVSEEREGESLRFIHLTFCEFLAAKEAAVGRRNGWDELLDKYSEFVNSGQPQLHARLNEVIPFAIALLPRSNREDAIEAVSGRAGLEIIGRCFLETQAYGSKWWPRYADQQRVAILASDPETWDTAWLQRLHLFSVVVQDAERWATASGVELGIGLDTVIGDLVGADTGRLTRVFSSYAQTDPAAAFRLAAACGLDLAAEEPGLVLENCSFPPFLAIAIQRAFSESGSYRWATLLAEAGLRSPFAAGEMHSRAAPPEMTRIVERVHAKRRWSPLPTQRLTFTRGDAPHLAVRERKGLSTYEAMLSLALGEASVLSDDTPALGIMRRVTPVGAYARRRRWVLPAIAVWIVTTVVVWSSFRTVAPLMDPDLIALIALLAGVSAASTLLSIPTTRLALYSSLVNFDPLREHAWFRPRRAIGWSAADRRRVIARLLFPRLLDAVREMMDLRRPNVAKQARLFLSEHEDRLRPREPIG
jgi:hypothetical protein